MKRNIFTRNWAAAGAVALAASALAVLPVQAQQSSTQIPQPRGASGSGSPSAADSSFARQACEGGMAEVKMGELAQQKATNPDVKALAKRLQDDHQKANDELKNLAQTKGIDLPTSMGTTQQTTIGDLEDKQGAEFDRAFVLAAIKDHQMDIIAFEQASRSVTDPDFKAWVEKTLPVLREHLQLAQKASNSLSKGSSSMEK